MQLKTLAEKNNYTCYWCKKKFALEDLSRDHIVTGTRVWKGAKAKGGYVLACIFCNHKRGNKPFEHFKWEMEQEKKNRQEELEKLWGDEV